MKDCCKKCGNFEHFRPSYHETCRKRDGEHLHYYCSWCGFDWTGDTLDER